MVSRPLPSNSVIDFNFSVFHKTLRLFVRTTFYTYKPDTLTKSGYIGMPDNHTIGIRPYCFADENSAERISNSHRIPAVLICGYFNP